MLSKKDYVAIAEIIADENEHWGTEPSQANRAIEMIAYGLADYFENDNPRFNRDKFMTACGLD